MMAFERPIMYEKMPVVLSDECWMSSMTSSMSEFSFPAFAAWMRKGAPSRKSSALK